MNLNIKKNNVKTRIYTVGYKILGQNHKRSKKAANYLKKKIEHEIYIRNKK